MVRAATEEVVPPILILDDQGDAVVVERAAIANGVGRRTHGVPHVLTKRNNTNGLTRSVSFATARIKYHLVTELPGSGRASIAVRGNGDGNRAHSW